MDKKLRIKVAGMTLCATIANGGAGFTESSSRCQEAYDAWVIASSLNIRPTASTKYSPIGSLFRGDKVTIIGPEVGGWVKIAFGQNLTKIGYVASEYLTDARLNSHDKSIKKVMYVNTNNLNMRKTASPSASKLGKLYIGDSVEIANSARDINYGGYTWIKCKAIIKPNGDKVVREFYVAKNYLSNLPVVNNTQNITQESKPVQKPEVSKPESSLEDIIETEKPQNALRPVVTENSVEIVANGKVVDVSGKVLITLKKGDKVTPTGDSVGIDKTSIKLNDGSFGLIHNSMLDVNFHLHEEFEYGRPCNHSNLGQSIELVEYISTKDLVGYNSDCDYFSKTIIIPKGTELNVALDTYNPVTRNIELAFKYVDENQQVVQGQAFVPVYQFR